MITLRKSPRADNTIDLDEKTSKYTLQIAIYFIEMENISKHNKKLFLYFWDWSTLLFTKRVPILYRNSLSFFRKQTIHAIYFTKNGKYIHFTNILLILYFRNRSRYFSLQKGSISSSQFSPSIWTSSYLGREVLPFLYTFYLFPTTRQTIVCPRTVCNAHSHYLF